jgi:signal transduction histidine kinase
MCVSSNGVSRCKTKFRTGKWVPEQLMLVDGDNGRLTQVFANLLINAAKFTDQGGRICISVGTECDRDWVLVRGPLVQTDDSSVPM